MKNIFTTGTGTLRRLIAASAIFLFALSAHAQNILAGLTSNGGPEGKGTAFSISTSGANFSLIKGFADWGKTPMGDLLKGDDGNFYGMTNVGGTYGYGTIFKMTAAGVITVLRQLNYTNDGGYPFGELIKGADGYLYGMTSSGGAYSYGTIFKISTKGVFTVLKNFSISADGSNPRGRLVLAKDGNFYGITYAGGTYGYGTIFKMTAAGVYTVLHSLNRTPDGGSSQSSLTEGTDGNLYGTTYAGGTYTYGTIFKITTAGVFTVLHHFSATPDGASCQSDLIQATDGNFYGTCYNGGTGGVGTIFKMTPSGTYSVLRALTWTTDGSNPFGNIYQNSDGFLYGTAMGAGTNSNGVVYKISLAGAYTVLHSFLSATEGATPKGGVVKGNDGSLYGMTSIGGANSFGTAYKITTAGTLTPLVHFHGAGIGNAPYESLMKGSDSAYYGTTSSGGAYNYGTIFKICGGVSSVVYSFNRTADGAIPKGSLIQANDGNYYGTTTDGGSKGNGTIFKITSAGVFTVLHHFNSATEGGSPQGGLVQGTDGNLYGLATSGGTGGAGSIYKITLAGTFTVLRQLVLATDGGNPEGNLIQATDGFFYGITNSTAKIFKIAADGTGFTVIHTMVGNTEGSNPVGSLVQAADGKMYGTASFGGTYGGGTVFSVTTAGVVTVLKHFNSTPDGKTPKGNLLIASDGNFYGLTSVGGTYNAGTIFKLSSAGTFTVLKHFNMDTTGGNPYGSLIIAPINNLVANPQSVTTNEDLKKVITLTGSGGGTLTYNIATNPKHGKVTGNGANKTYTPNANYYGNDQFTFTVSLGCLTSAPATVSITVTPVADSPVLASIGNKTVVVNTTLAFTATATDADNGQTLTYSLIGAPAGATINAGTGAFTWTPATAGSYTFKVRITDNGVPALYDEEQITVTVTSSFANAVFNSDASAAKEFSASVYPNPVSKTLNIALQNTTGKVDAVIADASGNILQALHFTAGGKNIFQADVSQLKPGTYFMKLQTANGNKTISFIKL